jgi:dolichol-phosphate mannosyltransferase
MILVQDLRDQLVFALDADLQDPPELLKDMYEKILEGWDVVYGERNKRDGESFFKKCSAAIFYRLLNRISMIRIPLDTGDFRLMRRRVVDELNKLPEGQRFIRGLVAWLGFRQFALKYNRDARYAGVTKYPLYKMISLSIDALTAFTISPLRIVLYISLLMILFSFIIFLWIAYSYIYLNVVNGWTSIAALLTLFSSII